MKRTRQPLPRENVTNDRIKRVLDLHRPYVETYRPVPSMYGGRYVDWIICAYGYYCAIEAKRPAKYPSDTQYNRLKDIEKARGATFSINSEVGIQNLAAWLDWCKAHPLNVANWPTIPERVAA